MPSCAPPCPIMSHCAPLCPVVPSCARRCPAMRHPAPSCPTVPHCVPLCPVVSRCAPSCPVVPPLPSQPPQAVAPGRAHPEQRAQQGPTTHPLVSSPGAEGTRWHEAGLAGGGRGRVPAVSPCPQFGPPPGPASPAAAVTQALALLPVKMEAPELLRVWVLAGEWQPRHPPWGHGRAWGTPPRQGGHGGDRQDGAGNGEGMGGDGGAELNKSGGLWVPRGRWAMGKLRQGGAAAPAPAPAPCLAAALVLGGTWAALPDHHVSLETGAVFVHELERELFQEAFLDEAEDDDDGEGQAEGSGDTGVWRVGG
ncbi:Alpha-sarcoglycan-like protein [Aix galericulata]|nr:Alpha-sarcoglycan-like protein [Aix galericulata]